MITHEEYLERHHKLADDARREINTLLGRDDFTEAKAALERWDQAVDALWALVQVPA